MSSMKDLLADRPYQLPSPPASVAFDGETYDPELDHGRLKTQLEAVFDLMKDGQWRTLKTIADEVGGSQGGVHARLRDFRKAKHGRHALDKRRISKGLWEYRVRVRA